MPGSSKSLSLFSRERGETLKPVPPVYTTAPEADRLWLAIDFPALPLEVFAAADDPRRAMAVAERKTCVLACNQAAQKTGLRPGLSLKAAYALAPDLVVLERSPYREQRALDDLAGWAEQFTSIISFEPPDALLLEVGGSRRLFGGLDALCARIAEGLKKQGYSVRMAVAPTSLAALWLARSDQSEMIVQPAQLAAVLGALSVQCLRCPERVQAMFVSMGIRRIADCLRLPRDGFVRRFGYTRMALLDRALGRLPDLRETRSVPPQFAAGLELPAEVSLGIQGRELLLTGIQRLLAQLGNFLLVRQSATRRLDLKLFHLAHPCTQLTLELLSPTRDREHLHELLGERLERLDLPAPVVSLSLACADIVAASHHNQALFPYQTGCGDALVEPGPLLERLRARLGRRAVHALIVHAEHRPEHAWQREDPGTTAAVADAQGRYASIYTAVDLARYRERPLWLLPEPFRLSQQQGWPQYRGRLLIHRGPERLETGWWNNADISRDYYIVSNPQSVRLWIFRERRDQRQWFLHGLFG